MFRCATTVGSAEVLVDNPNCRDRGRPADVTWLEQVKTKRDAIGASKAIAVASGNFSKKALKAADSYGIDARTLAQVTSAENPAMGGNAANVLAKSVLRRCEGWSAASWGRPPPAGGRRTVQSNFIKSRAFDAKFISYPEGLLSPLDVVRKIHPIPSRCRRGPELNSPCLQTVRSFLPKTRRCCSWLGLRQRMERHLNVTEFFSLLRARRFSQ